MCGHNFRTWLNIALIAVLFGNTANKLNANGLVSMMGTDNIIEEAIEIAQKNNMNIVNCNIRVLKKEEYTIVEFYPKEMQQLGGGGRVWFSGRNGNLIFCKIEIWQ
jgi:hypothetical protein